MVESDIYNNPSLLSFHHDSTCKRYLQCYMDCPPTPHPPAQPLPLGISIDYNDSQQDLPASIGQLTGLGTLHVHTARAAGALCIQLLATPSHAQ
jgi:hypothetical protein